MADTERKIWEGIYPTLNDVPQPGNVFSDPDWVSRNAAVVSAEISEDRDTANNPFESVSDEYHLPLVACMTYGVKKTLSVLDFGGALGTGFLSVMRALPTNANIRYTVVETPPMCDRGAKLFKNDSRIEFIPSMPAAPARPVAARG